MSECMHDKCFYPIVSPSIPPVMNWICRNCGETGSDMVCYELNEYETLVAKFKAQKEPKTAQQWKDLYSRTSWKDDDCNGPDSQLVLYFERAIKKAAQEERKKCLQVILGTQSRYPHGGVVFPAMNIILKEIERLP